MQRFFSSFLIAVLVMTLSPTPSNSAQKIGAKCTKMNKMSGKLICKKTKSGLVWKLKTVAVPEKSAAVQCSPKVSHPLPWSSQRIALLGMTWEKDPQGYVATILRLRNDNEASLRLVNYSLDYSYSGVKKTTSYNAGGRIVNHFFIKDDSQYMGIENLSGAWLPGQVRSFKIDFKEILLCDSIYLDLQDFRVISGIGDN